MSDTSAAAPAPLDPYVEAFPETRPFWDAAARGRLLLPRCDDCGRAHWHPRAHCPFCFSARLAWIEASGRGAVHACSVVRKVAEPYVLACVELAEGPILMTNVVGCAPEVVRIGMPVEVAFRQTPQGRWAPVFQPARGQA